MKAYITLLSTVSYLPGVVVLHDSVRQSGTSYPFVVAVSSTIPSDIDDVLIRRGMKVIRLPPPVQIPEVFRQNSGHWANTFDKLHLFGLTDFVKLVYLDSDMIVLKNIDELFEKSHLSAVAAGQREHPDWTRLNSGIMVIDPDKDLPEKMVKVTDLAIEQVKQLGSDKIGDQDVVNAYCPDWPDREELHLDDAYNLFFSDLDAYIQKHGYRMPIRGEDHPRDIRIIHFVGPKKPWMKGANISHCLSMLKRRSYPKWERKAFLMYQSRLDALALSKGNG